MKRKSILMSLSFSGYILLAILLQAGHSWNHLYEVFHEKHCDHKYNTNNAEIGHAHSDLDACFVCEFALSTTVVKEFLSFSFYKKQLPYQFNFFKPIEIIQTFGGSLFSLRGPPVFFK